MTQDMISLGVDKGCIKALWGVGLCCQNIGKWFSAQVEALGLRVELGVQG